MPPKVTLTARHQYDADQDRIEREATNVAPEGESLTVQSGKDDADINVIAARMGLLGIMPEPLDPAFYADASNLPDLRAILEYSRDAEQAFMALPANVRARFHNSAAELWEFVLDPENREEAIRIGLIDKPAPEAPEGAPNPPPATPEVTP